MVYPKTNNVMRMVKSLGKPLTVPTKPLMSPLQRYIISISVYWMHTGHSLAAKIAYISLQTVDSIPAQKSVQQFNLHQQTYSSRSSIDTDSYSIQSHTYILTYLRVCILYYIHVYIRMYIHKQWCLNGNGNEANSMDKQLTTRPMVSWSTHPCWMRTCFQHTCVYLHTEVWTVCPLMHSDIKIHVRNIAYILYLAHNKSNSYWIRYQLEYNLALTEQLGW